METKKLTPEQKELVVDIITEVIPKIKNVKTMDELEKELKEIKK